MSPLTYTALALLTLPASSAAQRSFKWLTPTRIDMGVVGQDAAVTFQFSLLNTGKDTLFIDNVRTDCSCTEAVWPLHGVPPGMKAEITLLYEGTHAGSFRKKAVVWIRRVNRPERIYISGRVE
jgi:Protein of unknown function (DUF1573)